MSEALNNFVRNIPRDMIFFVQIICISSILLWIVSYLWFSLNICGNTRFKNSFSGFVLFLVFPIGLARTEYGNFFIIGNIPVYGLNTFWQAMNIERKSMKIAWLLSFVLIPFVILAVLLLPPLSN